MGCMEESNVRIHASHKVCYHDMGILEEMVQGSNVHIRSFHTVYYLGMEGKMEMADMEDDIFHIQVFHMDSLHDILWKMEQGY